jgi:hypothetical protein
VVKTVVYIIVFFCLFCITKRAVVLSMRSSDAMPAWFFWRKISAILGLCSPQTQDGFYRLKKKIVYGDQTCSICALRAKIRKHRFSTPFWILRPFCQTSLSFWLFFFSKTCQQRTFIVFKFLISFV